MTSLEMMIIQIAVVLFLLSFRALYLSQIGKYLTRVGWGHRWHIRDIRAADHRLPERPTIVLTEGAYSTPFFAQWLASFVPDRHFSTISRFYSTGFDIFVIALLSSLQFLGYLSQYQLFLGVVIFLATPQFFRPDREWNRGFAPRKIGHLFLATSLIILLYGVSMGSVEMVIISIPIGGLVFLTDHRSAELYAMSVVLITLFVDLFAAIALLGSFIVAMLFSGGRYARVFFAHVYQIAQGFRGSNFDYSTAREQAEISVSAGPLTKLIQNRLSMTFLNNLAVFRRSKTGC